MNQFDASVWQTADPDAPLDSNDPPEPGEYTVVIAGARAFQSSKGNDIVIVEWNITNGPLTAYQWPDIYSFKNEGSVKAAKGMCARIGVDVEAIGSLEDLDARLHQRIGEYFTVEVKQNGQFRNTYVTGRPVGALSDIPNDGAFEPVPANDDDIPFLWEGERSYIDVKCHASR